MAHSPGYYQDPKIHPERVINPKFMVLIPEVSKIMQFLSQVTREFTGDNKLLYFNFIFDVLQFIFSS
jgi:hypothetical protein